MESTAKRKSVSSMPRRFLLGSIVSPEGISMDPDRIATIVEWPVPNSIHDARVFLGLQTSTTVYRSLFESCSSSDHRSPTEGLPFQMDLCRPNRLWEFKASVHVWTYPPTIRLCVTDSRVRQLLRICPLQNSQSTHDNPLHPVAFLSRKSSAVEFNYDIFDREPLAIVSLWKIGAITSKDPNIPFR